MKKLVMLTLAVFLAFPVFAAREDDDALYVSPKGTVSFDLFSHIGYGFHFVKSDTFNPNSGGELFLNVLKFGVYPAEWLGLELGVDMAFNNFNSKRDAFYLDNNRKIQVKDFSEIAAGTLDKHRGGFNVFSLNAPVLVKCFIGDVQLGVGAVASWNAAADAYYYFRQDHRRTEVSETKAEVNPFTYGFMATVSYDGLGLFFKYYPKSSKLLPEGSVDLSYMTLGIAIGL